MILWLGFLFLLPFGEGSASPAGLLIAHLLLLAAVAASAGRLAPLRPNLAGGAVLLLAVAGLSGALGDYAFASLLALVDLAAMLGTLVLGEALARSDPRFEPRARGVIVAAALVQVAVIAIDRVAPGSGARSAGTMLNANHAAAYLLVALWMLVAGWEHYAGGPWNRRRGSDGGEAFVRDDRRGGSGRRGAGPGDAVHAGAMDGGAAGVAARSGFAPAHLLRSPWAGLVIGSLLLAGVLSQTSRGAALALVAGGGAYLALRWREMGPRTRLAASLAGLLIVVAAGALLANRIVQREDPYLWERARIWKSALAVALEHPVIGAGPGMFGYVSLPHEIAHADSPVRYAKHIEATHSDYLRIAAETGLLGSIAFALFAAVIALGAASALRARGPGGAALCAALSGLLAQAAVDNLSARPAVTYTGALILGLLLARGAPDAPVADQDSGAVGAGEGPAAPGAARPTRWVLLYGGLAWAALALVVAPYLADSSFRSFRRGGAHVGKHFASALHWNPIQPDYRAALAEAVVAGRSTQPADLRAGFLAIEDAIVLNRVDPRFHLIKARLARRAFTVGGGMADWIRMAREAYARAIELAPLHAPARIERGSMEATLGEHARALADADAALALEPNFFEARRLRAAALADLGRRNDARAELEEALRRRAELAGASPALPYEIEILRWNEDGWRTLEANLT